MSVALGLIRDITTVSVRIAAQLRGVRTGCAYGLFMSHVAELFLCACHLACRIVLGTIEVYFARLTYSPLTAVHVEMIAIEVNFAW